MSTQSPAILVVDDQPGVRRLIQEIFRDSAYRVCGAANGQEALALAAAHAPDIALVDMKMPVMDGLETLKQLKEQHPRIAVLMMTAVGDGESLNEMLSHGAYCCINKPFDVFALRDLVKELLEEGAKRDSESD